MELLWRLWSGIGSARSTCPEIHSGRSSRKLQPLHTRGRCLGHDLGAMGCASGFGLPAPVTHLVVHQEQYEVLEMQQQ